MDVYLPLVADAATVPVSSGYLESQASMPGRFLSKPYTARELVDAVLAVLRQPD